MTKRKGWASILMLICLSFIGTLVARAAALLPNKTAVISINIICTMFVAVVTIIGLYRLKKNKF